MLPVVTPLPPAVTVHKTEAELNVKLEPEYIAYSGMSIIHYFVPAECPKSLVLRYLGSCVPSKLSIHINFF